MISKMDRKLIFGFMPTWSGNISNPPADFDEQMVRKMVNGYVQLVRQGESWDWVEPDPPQSGQHTYHWERYDERVNLLRAYGIELICTINTSPHWARSTVYKSGTATGGSNDPNTDYGYLDDSGGGLSSYANIRYEVIITGGTGAGQVRHISGGSGDTQLKVDGRWSTIPDSTSTYQIKAHSAFALPDEAYTSDFEAFCTALAQRYKGKIRLYEFWNEPNDKPPMFFDMNEYTKWLGRAYAKITTADPDALLAVGGLDISSTATGDYQPDTNRNQTNALNAIYDYIAQNTGNYFDAVALHPYERRPDFQGIQPINIDGVDAHRTKMVDKGDSAKSIWITEYGWDMNNWTQQQQRDWLENTLNLLCSASRSYVTAAAMHLFADHQLPNPVVSGVCLPSLSERLAYGTFRDYAAPRTPKCLGRTPLVQAFV